MEKANFMVQPLQEYSVVRKFKQNWFGLGTELLSYFILALEVLLNLYYWFVFSSYYTIQDQEMLFFLSAMALHVTFVVYVGLFHRLLILYIRDNEQITLKEFDRIGSVLTIGIIEEFLLLIGISALTYYVFYVEMYYPVFDTMIRIQSFATGKCLLNVIHYTIYTQIEHEDDPYESNAKVAV